MAPIYEDRLIYPTAQCAEGAPFAHCSNIVELDENTLMAQWYAGKAEQSKNQSIYASKFDKKSKIWNKPQLLSKSTEFPDGNGVLWKDPETKRLFLFFATMWTHSFIKKSFGRGWHHCKLFFKYSDDDGDTWSEIKTVQDKLGYMFRNKPIVLKNGRILIPMYQEVPAKGYMGISDDHLASLKFSSFIEDDEKYPKKNGTFIKTGNSQPTLIELDDGRIIALLRTQLHKKIFRSVSSDNGESWSPAQAINLPNPDAGIDMIRLQSGKMLLIFNNTESGRHNMSLAINKDDEGKEWKIVKTLEDDPKLKFSYPAIIQTQEGMIHATYTYNRRTIKHVSFNEDWLLE